MMSYTLQRVRKQYLDGTHRAKSPDETLVSVRPLMEMIGVEEVMDITPADRLGIPCFSAFRPGAARGGVRYRRQGGICPCESIGNDGNRSGKCRIPDGGWVCSIELPDTGQSIQQIYPATDPMNRRSFTGVLH